MTSINSKVCIVGDFAVGKTSTVERFVSNQFSGKYLTTVGVKIDTKEIPLREKDIQLKMVLWDVAGTDRFGDLEFTYLRGASAYVLVADGTRSATVSAALELRKQIIERYGNLPFVFLLNKSDLEQAWEISETELDDLKNSLGHVYVTSAKTGDEVEAALGVLAGLVVEKEFPGLA